MSGEDRRAAARSERARVVRSLPRFAHELALRELASRTQSTHQRPQLECFQHVVKPLVPKLARLMDDAGVHNMPELHWHYGYAYALALMIGVSAMLYFVF